MMPASTSENNTKGLDPENDGNAAVVGGVQGESSNILFNPEETENVEISKRNYLNQLNFVGLWIIKIVSTCFVSTAPDLFGHFLLDNEYSHDDYTDDDIQEIDESLDDEESESEVPDNTPEQSRPKRKKRNDGIVVSLFELILH